MYWLFRLHHISPIDVHKMTRRERKVLFAFVRYDLAKRNEEADRENEKVNEAIENARR